MVQINFALKEVNCKIVYYGPGMSGKTTNLEIVHRKAPDANKGELTSIATEGDRTLFFDFMPLDLGNIAGMRTKFQLYTVPGQVYYNSTRKLVLQGVDGIIFVADSQEGKMEENLESMENLRNNLAEYGKDLDVIPMVLQYNKRDLPNIMDLDYLNEKLNHRDLRWFEGVATTGEGVFPTLKALSAVVLESLSKEKRGAGAPPARRGPASKVKSEVPVGATAEGARGSEPVTAPPRARPEDTFGPESGLKEQVAQAQAQAASAPQSGRPPGPPDSVGAPPANAGARIRKGPSSFYTTPPVPKEEGERPAAPTYMQPASAPPGSMQPASGPAGSMQPASGPPASGPPLSAPPRRPPAREQVEPTRRSPQAFASPGLRGVLPPRATVPSPLVRKFVIEEERGSPILLIALVFIIVLAVGVILYSFKII